jgi:hypothetical protein
MNRRDFLLLAATASVDVPKYRVVTRFAPSPRPGMPGPYPGKAVRVHSEKSIDTATQRVDMATVREMLSRGMRSLTGAKTERDAWARFFDAKDVVGIKVNCSGAPNVRSAPEVVAGIVGNLVALDIPARNIYIYERFVDQLTSVPYERSARGGGVIRTRNLWSAGRRGKLEGRQAAEVGR